VSLLATVLQPLGLLLRRKRPDERLSVRHAAQLAGPRGIDLWSPDFAAGATIADRHCSMDLGPNVSPELRWTGVPPGAAQLLFIIEDLDVPASRPGLHTIALLPADTGGLPEGALAADNPGLRFVPNPRGRIGYIGPRPLPGHGIHRYRFHLYALDQAIPADHQLNGLSDVLTAVAGHVSAVGFLEGVRKG
jgi:phosphatidylethanolamine-binding protein (PEBP) family uncharacterized protein